MANAMPTLGILSRYVDLWKIAVFIDTEPNSYCTTTCTTPPIGMKSIAFLPTIPAATHGHLPIDDMSAARTRICRRGGDYKLNVLYKACYI
jgi:hypothetical protein